MFDPMDDQADEVSAKRAAPRDAMFLHVDLRRQSGPPLTLRVRNLSPGGMMVETPERFERGEPVTAALRNIGEVPARIAWAAGGRLGIAFDRPIDPRAARKSPPKSAGSTMDLVKPVGTSRRPGLKIG